MVRWQLPFVLLGSEAAICAIAIAAEWGGPTWVFAEGGPIGFLNALQLAAAAFVCAVIYAVRRRNGALDAAEGRFWLFVAVGSVYLALDEVLGFHEAELDLTVPRRIFGFMQGEYLTIAGIDAVTWNDFIELLYAVPVLAICWYYRRELLRDRRTLSFLGAGAVLLSLSALIDFTGFHSGKHLRFDLRAYEGQVMGIEESLKLLGFGGIVAGFINRLMSAGSASVELPRVEA